MKYAIVHTYTTHYTHDNALAFSACLGADKGVQSRVEERRYGHVVIADDGQAVAFKKTRRK